MAVYYFRNNTANWNVAANWSLTDGGGPTGAVPTATDDAIFTNLSGPCTVNITTAVCKTITFTTYTNTITMTNSIVVSGNITLGASMGVSGTGLLRPNATGTLTSNGKVWPSGMDLRGTSTFTLADNWVITGSLLIGLSTETIVINGAFSFSVGGSLTIGTSSTVSGAATIILNGTGTYSHSSTGQLRNNLTINTAGTITISGVVYYNTGTLTYTAGTVVTTGSTLSTSTVTLNTNGITWNNLLSSAGGTITITSNLTIGGNYTLTTGTQSWVTGANTVSIAGDMTMGIATYPSTAAFAFNTPNNLTVANLYLNTTASSSSSTNNCTINGAFTINVTGNFISSTGSFWLGYITGTTTIKLIGTGTFSSGAWGACLGLPVIIDTTGNITMGSTLALGAGSLTWVSGGVNATACVMYISNTQTIGLNKNIVFAAINQGAVFQPLAYNIGVTLTGDLATSGTYATGTFAPLYTTALNGAGYYLYVGGVNTQRTTSGTATIVFAYSGTWNGSVAFLSNNIIVDTAGTLTWGSTAYYQTGSITFIKGNFSTTPWYLYGNMTLINADRVVIPNIVVTAGLTITMNNMFSGKPSLRTNITSTTTANYTIAFQDNFEKVCRFARLSNCTASRPSQILSLTDMRQKGTNSGIRYINQSPNGIAKNRPTVPDPMTYPAGGLVQDPNFVV